MCMVFDVVKFAKETFRPTRRESFLFLVDYSNPERNRMVEQWAEQLYSSDLGFDGVRVLYHAQTGGHGRDLPEYGKLNGREIKINDALKQADIVWSLPEFSATRYLCQHKGELCYRAASSPSFKLGMLDTVMAESPAAIQKRGETLLPMLKNTEYVVFVLNDGKSYLQIDVRNVPWEEDLGKIFKGEGMELGNIPCGELCSPQHEGSLYDYLLKNSRLGDAKELLAFYENQGIPLLRKDGSVSKTRTHGQVPVYIGKEKIVFGIRNGFVVEILGDGEKARQFKEWLSKDSVWGYLAEAAFGLNSKARADSDEILESEKAAPHFALGSAAQAGGFDTPINPELKHHTDYPLVNPMIDRAILHFNGSGRQNVIENGRYTIFGGLNFAPLMKG